MSEKLCRLCGSRQFYVKNPEDAWETWAFEKRGEEIRWLLEDDQDEPPELTPETEIYCNTCAWHGKLKDIH